MTSTKNGELFFLLRFFPFTLLLFSVSLNEGILLPCIFWQRWLNHAYENRDRGNALEQGEDERSKEVWTDAKLKGKQRRCERSWAISSKQKRFLGCWHSSWKLSTWWPRQDEELIKESKQQGWNECGPPCSHFELHCFHFALVQRAVSGGTNQRYHHEDQHSMKDKSDDLGCLREGECSPPLFISFCASRVAFSFEFHQLSRNTSPERPREGPPAEDDDEGFNFLLPFFFSSLVFFSSCFLSMLQTSLFLSFIGVLDPPLHGIRRWLFLLQQELKNLPKKWNYNLLFHLWSVLLLSFAAFKLLL